MLKTITSKLVIFLIVAVSCNSCRSSDVVALLENDDGVSKIGIDFVSHAKNLNIVYFTPNDNPPIERYKERLSDLLIYFQEYVKSEMNRYDFGNKTFGLPVDALTGKVKFIVIKGKEGQNTYDYSSSSKILAEIDDYKKLNPSEFSQTDHTLIILPEREDKGRQPFFGIGKVCFALDNPNIKVEEIAITKSNYIGGMLHELGHGLNLPHNHAKISEENELGVALMGAGNQSWGRVPTFMTEASCAILNRNEIFQDQSSIAFYQKAVSTLDLDVNYDEASKSIQVFGTYESDTTVSDVLVWLDPNVNNEGMGANRDYNSIAWRAKNTGKDSYEISLPLKELQHKGDTQYELKIKLIMENGSINTTTSLFDFVEDIPDFISERNVTFYQHCSFGGNAVELETGTYITQQMVSAGILDNDISSFNVPLGKKVTLYENDSFSDMSHEYTASSSCVFEFNDKTSSIKIKNK